MDDGNGAVYVSALRSGGAAAQAGLLLGERVLSVNGVAAATHARAIGSLASPASRDHHTVVVSGRVREWRCRAPRPARSPSRPTSVGAAARRHG